MKMYYVAEVVDWNNGTVRRISPLFDIYQDVLCWEAPDRYLYENLVTCSSDVVMENDQPSVGEL